MWDRTKGSYWKMVFCDNQLMFLQIWNEEKKELIEKWCFAIISQVVHALRRILWVFRRGRAQPRSGAKERPPRHILLSFTSRSLPFCRVPVQSPCPVVLRPSLPFHYLLVHSNPNKSIDTSYFLQPSLSQFQFFHKIFHSFYLPSESKLI